MNYKNLNLWTDGVDTFVAESAEDARGMQIEMTAEPNEDADEFRVLEDKGPLTFDLLEEDLVKVTLTHAEWIERNGPGFLCSTKY